MTKIFVSYRRIDTAGITARICKLLRKRFGGDSLFLDVAPVFRDVRTVPLGDFRQAIRDYLDQCDVLLAVIGRQWMEATDFRGVHRLSDPADYVRMEIEAALARDIPIIPVLVDGVSMPQPSDFPHELRNLTYRQAISLRSERGFRDDVRRLTKAIEGYAHVYARPARKTPPPSSRTARPTAPRSRGKCLTDLLHLSSGYTVITGARRSQPWQLLCDMLLSVDWADFALIDQLPTLEGRRLVPDSLFADDWRVKRTDRDVFRTTLVAVGRRTSTSPPSNSMNRRYSVFFWTNRLLTT